LLRWHVLFTKPRMEHRVSETLAGRDIDVFLPVLWYHGKRGDLLDKPFFPRYLFARLDWEHTGVRDVQWTPGLTRVVAFMGKPAWLPDDRIAYLRDTLECLDGDAFLALKPGERVRIKRGPFAELEAVFDRQLNGERRVAVLLEILGRQTCVVLNAEDVDRIA